MRRLTFFEVHFRIYIARCLCNGEGALCEGLICEMAECHCGGSGSGKGGKASSV